MAAKRLNHLDTLKFFAIVWVYTVHLIDQYCPELLDLWTQTPTAYLLKGISGKACVALFCLLLGYFAFAAGKAKKYSPLTYSVRRYLYFFVCALFIKGLYWFSARLGYFPAGLKERPGFVQTLLSSLFLDGGIYLAFWCIAPFLLGSVLTYIGGYFNLGIKELIPIVLSLMLVGQIWVVACLMGCFLYWIRERRWNLPWYVRIAILILVFVLLYREESYMTVFIDCICILALTPVIEGTSWGMRVLNNRVTASLGKRSMSIYLLHVWMYSVPGLWLNQQLMGLPTSLRLILLWLIPLVVLCALSYPVSALLDWIAAFLYRITSMLAARISAFLKKHNILQCRNKAD